MKNKINKIIGFIKNFCEHNNIAFEPILKNDYGFIAYLNDDLFCYDVDNKRKFSLETTNGFYYETNKLKNIFYFVKFGIFVHDKKTFGSTYVGLTNGLPILSFNNDINIIIEFVKRTFIKIDLSFEIERKQEYVNFNLEDFDISFEILYNIQLINVKYKNEIRNFDNINEALSFVHSILIEKNNELLRKKKVKEMLEFDKEKNKKKEYKMIEDNNHIKGEDVKIILDFCSSNDIKCILNNSNKIFDFAEFSLKKNDIEATIQIDINDKEVYFFVINSEIESGDGFIRTNDLNKMLDYVKNYM